MLHAEDRTISHDGLSTRERILRATREIFERNGTRGTTTREVADRAGVNEATIFRHFGNKTNLLEAMRGWSAATAGLTAVVDNLSGDLAVDLTLVCNAMYRGMTYNKAIIRISLAEEATDPGQLPSCFKAPTEIMHRLVAYLQGHIDSGAIKGNARQLAAMIMGMMFALAMKSDRLDWGEEGRPEALIPVFVNTFLTGVKN